MALVPRPFPAALPHGDIREVAPGLFFVKGTMRMPTPLPVRVSRNMTVVREGERLILINTVRLDDAGLRALEKLGQVTDVLRIAGNHGMDDPFYADRYKAKVWALRGHRYTPGFDTKVPDVYFEPHAEVDATTALPIKDARVHFIASKPPEGLLLLPHAGGTLVAGDCLQHWATTDEYFNWLAKLMTKRMGFIQPHNVGPAWFKGCKPPKDEVRALLELPFANVLPAHGEPVVGDAVRLYRPAVERVTA